MIKQYQQIIGRPYLPAYWALGYQFCRYGFKGLTDLKDTIARIQNAKIPIDVMYADIDYMERYKDFTTGQKEWGDFPAYAEQKHKEGLKLTLIFDPAIEVDYEPFSRAIQKVSIHFNKNMIFQFRMPVLFHGLAQIWCLTKSRTCTHWQRIRISC